MVIRFFYLLLATDMAMKLDLKVLMDAIGQSLLTKKNRLKHTILSLVRVIQI